MTQVTRTFLCQKHQTGVMSLLRAAFGHTTGSGVGRIQPSDLAPRCQDLYTNADKGYLGAELNMGPVPKIAWKDWKGEIQVANPALPL